MRAMERREARLFPERRDAAAGPAGRENGVRRALLFGLVCLALLWLPGWVRGEGISPLHVVTNTYTDTKKDNGAIVRLWQVETAVDTVSEEINGIAAAWAEERGADLPKAANSTSRNSRLDVEIRYSRTGHSYLSFLVQARTQYHRENTDQVFTTRTYDMSTGERLLLRDLFDEDPHTWEYLAEGVRQGLTAYWPDVEPDPEKLEALCGREALEEADFTLHGMSLVLHYPAETLYEGKKTIMAVTFFYPQIRDMMTENAYLETDNLSYYRTCALTFDDGPSGTNTPKVLTSLMETGATATFFVIGNRVSEYDYLVQREHDEGHAVASHNWHHGNVTKSSGAALRAMPARVNKAMVKAIGIPVRYDRVPGGRYPAMIKAKVGWAYIQWSLDTYDWRGRKTSEVMSKVKRAIQDGDIILCHDIKENTPETTRQMVRYLEEQGYMLLTIDELFAKDGVTLEPDTVYYRCQNGDTSKRDDT
ncbi:MAG: polysaccharide deacetylase family protein [Clostridia bacterium]|nr:polysaccharide deacetylase family protein [Clostridia bacterium]